MINRLAFRGEQVIHGNPSGVDNAVSTWGWCSLSFFCISELAQAQRGDLAPLLGALLASEVNHLKCSLRFQEGILALVGPKASLLLVCNKGINGQMFSSC